MPLRSIVSLFYVVGRFVPPPGLSPTSFELNNLEVLNEEECVSAGFIDETCDLKPPLSLLPKHVEEFTVDEGSSSWLTGLA